MASEKLARRYATAVFALASQQGAVDRVGTDLAQIASSVKSDATIANFFVAPTVDRKDKEAVFTTAFASKVDEIALHTVLLLIRKRREAILDALIAEYHKLDMQARGAEPLLLTTARDLTDGEVRALVQRLEAAYNKKFDVRVKREPGLIGGVRVTMGDRRIDGTVAGRLEELTRTLFAQN